LGKVSAASERRGDHALALGKVDAEGLRRGPSTRPLLQRNRFSFFLHDALFFFFNGISKFTLPCLAVVRIFVELDAKFFMGRIDSYIVRIYSQS
jgi:hypothetical protein